MKEKFVVREARASDKDLVLRFAQKTFEWGDYIEHVWDSWLADPNGRLFVATFKELPVGVNHVVAVKRGEAWAEGARVAPEFRRMGVARLLNDACFEWARVHGAKIIRAVTDSTNSVAQKALMKYGFKFVSDWAIMEFDGLQLETSQNARFAEKSNLDTIWRFLQDSQWFKESGGLYAVVFRWKSLGKIDLRRFISRRMAIMCERDNSLCGLILLDDTVRSAWQENIMQISYVDGDFEASLSMGRFLKATFYEDGLARIHGAMLNAEPIVSAFSELGFVKGDHTELVYEKELS
jgi:GNAT superfamily N-acetyltransferase